LVHDPDWQLNPVAQSVFPAQVVRQAPPEQAYGAQLLGVWTQPPAPSQCPTGVNIEPVQDVVPQLLVFGA
jgi:hypothetical protein